MTREEARKRLRGILTEAVEFENSVCYVTEEDREPLEMAIQALEQEPKTGHWIEHQEGRWIYAKCSNCGTVHNTQTNYCPTCGFAMERTDI